MTASADPPLQHIGDSARTELKDAHTYVFFDDSGRVLASSSKADVAELKALTKAMDDREDAVSRGMTVNGQRYEVHRHHPPLVYGRTMGVADPDLSEGAALCMVADRTVTGRPCYGFITYKMPNLSARMVPMLEAFCHKHLQSKSA